MATDIAKVRKFEDGMKLSIRGKVVGLLLQDLDFVIKTIMALRRWLTTHGTSGRRVLKIRGRRANLFFLAQGRSRGLLLRKGFKDRAASIKAKARVNHPKVRYTSRLLASQGKEHVTIATSLDIGNRIALRGRDDTLVPVISGTFTDSVCSYLPHHGLGESVLVLGCCTCPYYFIIRPDGPGHGLRSRPGLTNQDFRDQGHVYAITPKTKLAD